MFLKRYEFLIASEMSHLEQIDKALERFGYWSLVTFH